MKNIKIFTLEVDDNFDRNFSGNFDRNFSGNFDRNLENEELDNEKKCFKLYNIIDEKEYLRMLNILKNFEVANFKNTDEEFYIDSDSIFLFDMIEDLSWDFINNFKEELNLN